jgi:hypothetical protein
LHYHVEESRSRAVVVIATLIKFPHDAGWHTNGEMVGGNISRDDTTCTYHTTITNGDAGKDSRITSNPAIIADFDVSRKTRRIVRWIGAFRSIQSVSYAIEVHVRPEKTSLADFYRGDGSVKNVTVPIDECGTADAHVGTVIDEDWCLDIRNRAEAWEKIRMAVTWQSCTVSCWIVKPG